MYVNMSENQMTNSYETFAEKTTDLQPKNSLVECNKYSAVKYLCENDNVFMYYIAYLHLINV